MEVSGEISEVFVVCNLVCEAAHLRESHRLMESNFRLRGLDVLGGIPGTALRAAESGAIGPGVREGRVDDARIWNIGHKLVRAYSRQPSKVGNQPVIGSAFDLKPVLKHIVVWGEAREYALLVDAVFGLNEAACVFERDCRDRR